MKEVSRAMPLTLSDLQARRLRLNAQQLVARLPGSSVAVVDTVRALVGVQAQESTAAGLALRARCHGLAAGDVETARVRERSVVRTWCLRGTLHLVAAEDLGWLLALLGPGLIQAGRRRRAELGLDAETGERGVRALRDMLAEQGPLTRAEIAGRLSQVGIPTAGQATIHLIGLAALHGKICYGPDRDASPTFVTLDGWAELGPALPPGAAQTELVRRYMASYGPSTPEDLATWSGLPRGEARAAWQRVASELVEVEVRGKPAWLLREHVARLEQPPEAAPLVRLVPGYDPYLLGYRSRDLAVDAAHARRVHPGGGLLHPALLVDGRAAGTWKIVRRRNQVQAVVELFDEIDTVHRELQAEIEDIPRFLAR